MKLSWLKALGGFFLAAVLAAPAFGAPDATTAVPGTLNFVEGQASIQNQPLSSKSVGETDLQPGQTLTTTNGRAEVLLTPGVFLRLDHNSQVKMISPDLTNTKVQLEKGRAEVEVAEIHKQNDLQIQQGDATTRLLKTGLYDFSANKDQVRVFKGEAQVFANDKKIKVKAGHQLTLNAPKLKEAKLDKKADENDFYNWSSLRSEYLSDASANAAQIYMNDGWIGPGWYWDPGYYDYTFIPGAGMLYSPFGPWGFYSPGFIYSYGPYLGYPLVGGYYLPSATRYGVHPGRPVPPSHEIARPVSPHVTGGFRGTRGFSGPAFRSAPPPTSFPRAGGFRGGMGGFHGGGFRH